MRATPERKPYALAAANHLTSKPIRCPNQVECPRLTSHSHQELASDWRDDEDTFDDDDGAQYHARSSAKWILGVIVVQVVCQLALLFEQLAPLRLIFRVSSFGFSVFAFAMLVGSSGYLGNAPAKKLAIAVLLIVAFNIVIHPTTSSLVGGLATLGFYFAIIAPVFWVPNLIVTRDLFTKLIWAIFLFHLLSTTFGVLQTFYPGRFQPALSKVISNSIYKGDNLKITLADGQEAYRPMGLTDIPGGAGVAGFYTVVFGLGIWLTSNRQMAKVIGAVGIFLGAYCIYLSQVRSLLVLIAIIAIALFFVSIRLGRIKFAVQVAILIPVVLVGAFAWATMIGGEATVDRFSTLMDGSPTDVYQQNRGGFLAHTLYVLLPEYPLGAGLARWGMMNAYFGGLNRAAYPIWAEIQWTGWLLDGGVPLVIFYPLAVAIAAWNTYRAAFYSPDEWLSGWGLLLVAYSVGLFAQTFGSVPFSSQFGLEFWLLQSAFWSCTEQSTIDDGEIDLA